MKKLVYLFVLFSFLPGHSQIFDPVTWSTSVERVSDQQYDLIIIAAIEPGWHLYSQYVPEGGPIPTSFRFSSSEAYEWENETQEGEGIENYDPIFEMQIKFFADQAEFRQRVRLNSEVSEITGSVEFMVCDDQRCLPPTSVDLRFNLPKTKSSTAPIPEKTGISLDIPPEQTTVDTAKVSPIESPGVYGDKQPEESSVDTACKPLNEVSGTEETPEQDASPPKVEGEVKPTGRSGAERGMWGIFLISFLSGFAALLTPCVFPMIPLTVSFFTKQSKTRAKGIQNAIVYGLSIVVIYVLLGSVVTLIFGADALNALSTNVWFNLAFFVLLVIFALSFLGAFEIVLPSSWSTKLDSKADRGGLIGIFFMALALAVVSFSCTGPIVGTLLVEAASKGGTAPVIGMLGFSLAIALPFALFAAFPGWMNTLPKSGGWLNTVKVVLGFLELALAFKFLSNADLVLQLHLLERETFLVIWIAIFGALGFYLLGKIRLPHDAPSDSISVGRLMFGLMILAFTIYMIPGLWGAPLQWISGFPPPLHYSESPQGLGGSGGVSADSGNTIPPGAELGPHNIVTFKDYETGMAYAREVDKPVLLDFTGYACVNCRKMEERVWSDPSVLSILKNEIVLISLYVDDKKELPEREQFVSATTGKRIKTIGNKWSNFQIEKYRTNAQPQYVLLDHQGNDLNPSIAYEPEVEIYFSWLREGIDHYN